MASHRAALKQFLGAILTQGQAYGPNGGQPVSMSDTLKVPAGFVERKGPVKRIATATPVRAAKRAQPATASGADRRANRRALGITDVRSATGAQLKRARRQGDL